MKKISKSLVFFGNERLSSGFRTTAPTLRSLIKAGYDVKAVIINQADKERQQLEIAQVAAENHITVLSPQKPSDILAMLRDLQASIGILAAYGKIMPEEIINAFPYGILNIHPSLLPLYRGPTPIEQAMLDGAETTGVSIIRLVSKMDAGPVYVQKKIKLTGQEEKQELTERLLNEGAELLLDTLPDIIGNKLQPKPQDEAKASYCALISKESGQIDCSKSAIQIEREIRAYAGWPNSYCKIGNIKVTVTKAKVHMEPLPPKQLVIRGKSIFFGCKAGSLEIIELKPAGKKNILTADFLNGYYDQIKNVTDLG